MTDKLARIIVLKDGRQIASVADFLAFLDLLPEQRQLRPHWQKTCEMLLQARESGDDEDMAHATSQLARALQVDGWVR